MANYRVYYDSGTTNSRIYLLDDGFNIVYTASEAVGSKDSATQGSNRVLVEALKRLYDGMLEKSGVAEGEIDPTLYGSGMLTSPHGLMEIPHLLVPVDVAEHARQMRIFHESTLFDRDFLLVPGLKTSFTQISDAGNMRGEEMEIIGVMDAVEEIFPGREVALIFPGSHTHTALVANQGVRGILSQMTGELFFAMREDTLLAPTLTSEDRTLYPEMVKRGMADVERFGFNRAIYIAHAMNVFGEG
ncbi:MAG: 2-dehydro-3-deoxygalactonokinase, partial [Atopobiaceae bacterium]|nr:2-dehydro-3-deoxygalactonokinase [Atopobiaceae bacterium]